MCFVVVFEVFGEVLGLSYSCAGGAGGNRPVKKSGSPGGWGPCTMRCLILLLIASCE